MSTDPSDELSTEQLLSRLTAAIEGLRTDVQQERVGRRSNRVLGGIGLVVGLTLGLFGAKSYVDAGAVSCESRARSRAEMRTALVGVADETALYFEASEEERAAIRERAAARVERDLPPPDCGSGSGVGYAATTTGTTTLSTCAGRGPFLAGEPGYDPALDRDGDGIACE